MLHSCLWELPSLQDGTTRPKTKPAGLLSILQQPVRTRTGASVEQALGSKQDGDQNGAPEVGPAWVMQCGSKSQAWL